MKVWHVTIPSAGRHPLTATEVASRRAVLALARVAGRALALFCVADDHIHLVVVGDRPEVGRRAQAVCTAIGRPAAVRMGPARIDPVESRRHMMSLVRYVLGQPSHHGLGAPPALWTGSAYLDLVGARVLPDLSLRLREVLPRLDRRDLGEAVGLAGFVPRAVSLPEVRRQGAFRLATAAGATLAARPDLGGNQAPVCRARVAVARLADAAGIPNSEVAAALRVTVRSARRLRTCSCPGRILEAVRIRLALEAAVGARRA